MIPKIVSDLTDCDVPSSIKNEASFTTWFGGKIKSAWGFFWKISDIDTRVKPFDWFMAYKWHVCALEFKSIPWMSCHPFQLLRWSSPKNPWGQVKWLADFFANGWISLIIVYSKKCNRFKIIDFSTTNFNTQIKFLW